MQTPRTSQRSFKPAAKLSDFSGRESSLSGISPAGEVGALDGTTVAFFSDFPLMKRANGNPRIESFSGRQWIHVKEWSSGLQLSVQHFAVILMGMQQLAKPKFFTGCRLTVLSLTGKRTGLRTSGNVRVRWEHPVQQPHDTVDGRDIKSAVSGFSPAIPVRPPPRPAHRLSAPPQSHRHSVPPRRRRPPACRRAGPRHSASIRRRARHIGRLEHHPEGVRPDRSPAARPDCSGCSRESGLICSALW